MSVAAISSRPLLGPEACFTGASAALAEARKTFLTIAPPDVSWADVTAQAAVLRANEPMSLVQSLQVVLNRLAAGH